MLMSYPDPAHDNLQPAQLKFATDSYPEFEDSD
jgi:hypothetical protein